MGNVLAYLYRLVLVWLLCLTVVFASEFDATNPTHLKQLKLKYKQAEIRYKTLRQKPVHLSEVEQMVAMIQQAKASQQYSQLNDLLSDFLIQLDALENTNAQQVESSTALNTKPRGESDASPDIKSVESQWLARLKARPYFLKLHQIKGAASHINQHGAMSRNLTSFSDVAAQRDALWVLRNGILAQDQAVVAKAVLALEYAFEYQTSEGNFSNGRGVSARTAVGVDAFYLYALGYAYQLLGADGRFPTSYQRLDAHRSSWQKAISWLANNSAELYRQDKHTPNRLLFDAMAFSFANHAMPDANLKKLGRTYLQRALYAQRDDGAFIEKGGHDSSYQAVCLLNLSWLALYSEDSQEKVEIQQAMTKGAAWLAARISAKGEVSKRGNTRTGSGQEIQSGKEKDINYPEVALSLYYASELLNQPEYADKADKVVAFALAYYGYD